MCAPLYSRGEEALGERGEVGLWTFTPALPLLESVRQRISFVTTKRSAASCARTHFQSHLPTRVRVNCGRQQKKICLSCASPPVLGTWCPVQLPVALSRLESAAHVQQSVAAVHVALALERKSHAAALAQFAATLRVSYQAEKTTRLDSPSLPCF